MGSKLNLSPPRISRRCPSPCRSEGRWMMIAKALCSNSVSFRNNQPHGKLLHQSMELDFKSVKKKFATYKSRKKRWRHSGFLNNVERSCNIGTGRLSQESDFTGYVEQRKIILHCKDRKAHSKSAIQKPQSAFCKTKTLMHSMHTHSGMLKSWCTIWNSNIAKGTTDPRVEFISQDHSLQFTNLEHITISKSRLCINFKISTKHQYLD